MTEGLKGAMEGFFSLFDPADGNNGERRPKKDRRKGNGPTDQQDTAKKKTKQTKSPRKNAHLPDESSFLCEPDLTNDVLVKDSSYLDHFIEEAGLDFRNVREDNANVDKGNNGKDNLKVKRRSRRRRGSKNTPNREIVVQDCSCSENVSDDRLNNRTGNVNKKLDVGRNVNNLCYDSNGNLESFTGERKDESYDFRLDSGSSFGEDDFFEREFGSGEFCSEGEGSSGETSEGCEDDESGDEVYGSLPPEPQLGNVEYKLKLVNPSKQRLEHLVTQLKWRLISGGGVALYELGVGDCGALRGLRPRALRASLRTLRRMAAAIGARPVGGTTRCVAPGRFVAEVIIKQHSPPQQHSEVRVAVTGANEAGKSSLVGVLTQGARDNGRGSARLNMFRHLHEVRSGRTSSLSHEILGFDDQGRVVNYGCSELMTAQRIGERSCKLVSFLDLAGHSKYQRTTVQGLLGYSPHAAMLVVSATAGLGRITEEHLGLLVALHLPFFVVVTKMDLVANGVDGLLVGLQDSLDSSGCKRRPLVVDSEEQAFSMTSGTCHSQRGALEPYSARHDDICTDYECGAWRVPVFPVSCVTGVGLNVLHSYLLGLAGGAGSGCGTEQSQGAEFQVDEIFNVEGTGVVVAGVLTRGGLLEGDELLIGPLDSGDFVPITISSVYRNRVPCNKVRAGQAASLGLRHRLPGLRPRQGMVLVSRPEGYVERPNIEWEREKKKIERKREKDKKLRRKGGFRTETTTEEDSPNEQEQPWTDRMHPNDKLALHDLAEVEAALRKEKDNGISVNTFQEETGSSSSSSGSDSEKEGASPSSADEDLLVDDPNDPRGCLFFQANVRLLKHSTAIYPGFQATVHIGNIRQTAVIEGIMTSNSVLRATNSAPVLFRFVRQPEYVRAGRQLIFRDGLVTCGVGHVTQVFPYKR